MSYACGRESRVPTNWEYAEGSVSAIRPRLTAKENSF